MESILFAEVYLLCIIIVTLEIVFAIKDIDKSISMRLFIICFAFMDLSFVFGLLFNLAVRGGAEYGYLMAAKQLYFLCTGLGAFSWFVFAEYQFSAEILSKKRLVLAMLPFAVRELFLLCTAFLPWGSSLLTPGAVLWLPLVIDYGYISVSGFRAHIKSLNKCSYIKKDEYSMIAVCAAISLLCALLQVLIKVPVPLICAGSAVCAVLLYQLHQSKLISRDPLTGITNRIQLVQYLSNKMSNHAESLYMILMDIDGLKKINEAYGHNQGDEALIQVTQTLKETVPRNFLISRYGGDEFVITGEISTEEQILIINEGIKRNMARRNSANGRDWNVSVSIGFAKYMPEMKCVPDFFSEASASLSTAKKQRCAEPPVQ